MLEKAKKGRIHCIIVKDFSRFGRNYIEVSDYIDQIFPFLGVRFIAVNEHYDSKTAIAALGVDMAMKNIIYDLYSKDLSVKVRSARKSLMKKGDYIAPFAIYGYTNKVEKKRLVIDSFAAEVVRRMFGYAADGENARRIAIRLNEEGVLPPNAYNKSKSAEKMHYIPMDTAAIWTGDIVRRILQDERYTGKMVCGKYTSVNRKTILLPKDEWVVTPGTHEAIVSEEIFRQAQSVFRTRKEIVRPDKPKSILVGMLKCTHCNKTLVFESRYRRRFYCHSFNMGIGCEQATIDEPELVDTIYTVIKAKLELVQASEETVLADRKSKAAERDVEIRECEKQLKKLKLSQTALLEQMLEGKLTKEKYQTQKAQITEAVEEAKARLASLENLTDNAPGFVESHRPFFGQDALTREMVQGLIKEIRVTAADEIEIVWRFAECYNGL
jgi:DNA invertase Pin-like site-specific DNA recombinase